MAKEWYECFDATGMCRECGIRFETTEGKKEHIRANPRCSGNRELTTGQPQQEEILKTFLYEGEPPKNSLGCGFHNGAYYFGTKVYRDGKAYTAVVTSDKEMYVRTDGEDHIKTRFGLNYKQDFYEEGISHTLSKNAISKFLYENTDDITIAGVHKKVSDVLKRYVYLEDERKYALLACFRIAGFFMPVWWARARLFIFAEWGASKSRLTNILHNTGFNSTAVGDWTIPYLQRLIESTRGEVHIDDFETLDEEKKKGTIRLVKVGYMKGFKSGKVSDGVRKKPETYDLFNTTTINNTEGLDFISTDRCITLRIPKIENSAYSSEPNFNEPIWKELRDELYILGLKYPKEVEEAYAKIKSDRISGRLLSIVKPELTIAKMISEETYDAVETFWAEEIEQRKTIDYETDWEFLAFKRIYELGRYANKSREDGYFSPLEEIVKPFGILLYPNDEEFNKRKRGISKTIGNILTRSPIFKKRYVQGKAQYNVRKEEFISLLKAKGWYEQIEEMVKSNPTNSTSSTSSTNSTNSTSPLFSEKKVELVEEVELIGQKPYGNAGKIKVKFLRSVDGYAVGEHFLPKEKAEHYLAEGDCYAI